MSTPTNRAFTAGAFGFYLDGQDVSSEGLGFVKSVDGGYLKGEVVEEQIGPDQIKFKHLGTLSVEPITCEIGMALSKPLFKWINASWNKSFDRMDGMIVHADFNHEAKLEQHFYRALIEETTFPALDASDKNPAYLKLKFQPEGVTINKAGGEKLKAKSGTKQKLWSPSNFYFKLGDLDCGHVNKIDGFSIKQKIKPLHTGKQRFPELEPVGVTYPDLTIYMAAAYADSWFDWHDKFLLEGGKEPQIEKDGYIEFMAPNGVDSLFKIELAGVGMKSLSIEKSEANSDTIKRVKVELYVESMVLAEGGFGLE